MYDYVCGLYVYKSLYVYVYVHVYVYAYMYIYICVYTYKYTHIVKQIWDWCTFNSIHAYGYDITLSLTVQHLV